MNRPSSNATGVIFLATAIVAKRLELLRVLVPKATTVAILFNPDNPDIETMRSDARDAVRRLGLAPLFLDARTEHDLDAAFATLVQQRADALLVGGDRLFVAARNRLSELAMRNAIPTIHDAHDYHDRPRSQLAFERRHRLLSAHRETLVPPLDRSVGGHFSSLVE
jgi:putative ABC transport system substrate-binding protein